MDTKTLIITAIGSALMVVLLFRRTVLSIKWWKKSVFKNSENRRNEEQQRRLDYADRAFTSSHHHITQSKAQSLVQVKKFSKWNDEYDLINKEVFSCEMADIGSISAVENQFMTIIYNGKNKQQQQYVIPTYYVRACDNERVLIDTSVRYLNRYQVKQTNYEDIIKQRKK